MKNKFIFFLFVLAHGASAQDEYKIYSEKYPKENGVILKSYEDVVITINSAGHPAVSSNIYEERLFLDENYKYYLNESVPYSSFNEISNLRPEVLIPGPKGYKRELIKDIKDEDNYDSGVFHDDSKTKVFYYGGLVKGGKTILSYTNKFNDPHFFGSYYFSSFLPVEEASVSITAPSDMQIICELFGDLKEHIEYTSIVKGSATIHTWKCKELPKLDYQSRGVSVGYYATHAQFRIGSYKYKGEDKYLLRDLADLYEYYYDFVREINQEEIPELKAIADSLTTNLETEEDKVKAIFYWVQNNIKYVALEEGMGGFIPREASLVCDRRYGDCKDMSSILYYMINSIGIPAHYTWIGTRDIAYTYDQVPTPKVDNHMICTYMKEDQPIFLDATGKDQPFGWPTSFIQGKQALIGIDEKNYMLHVVPTMTLEDNISSDTAYIRIQEGDKVAGDAKIDYNGYSAQRLRSIVQNLDDVKKDEFYRDSFKKGHNKSSCDVDSLMNLENKEQPLIFYYHFDIEDYLKRNNDEIYLNLFLKKYYKGEDINLTVNKVDIENDHKRKISSVVYLEIPDGYQVSYVPENSEYTGDEFGFSARFEILKDENKLKLEYEIYETSLVIEKERFEEWNKFIKKLNQTYSESIILQKK